MKFKAIVMMFLTTLPASYAAADNVKAKSVNNSCGLVTVYKTPPKTKNIHFASVNSIDGEVVTSGTQTFALTPGKHIIKVVEQIRENSLTRRRGEMKNYKFIEVNIEANHKYDLGAKFIRKNRSKLKTGEYWQPVVWKTSESECNLG